MSTLIEYRNREHWSYSALNQFLNICSLQFAFDRIYKLEKAFTPLSLAFGSAFHRTLEWLHLTRKEGKLPETKAARERFHDFWLRQVREDKGICFDQGKDADACAEQGGDLIEAFLLAIDPAETVIAVNRAFAVPLIDARGNVLEKPMIGEIDCVVLADGRACEPGNVTLVDWKTSARRWSRDQAEKSLQPTVYLYAWRQLHAASPVMRFDVVVKNKKPVVEQHETIRSPDRFHRMVELVKRVESMIAAEHFLPNETGMYCSGCPHQEACKSWHREQARVHVPMAA